MQMQNAGRTSGSGCSGCVEACDQDWEKNGDQCYLWNSEKKNWTDAEDFARRKEDIWPLSTQMQPSTSSCGEWLDSALILPGWEATILRRGEPGSGQTALPGISRSGHQENQ